MAKRYELTAAQWQRLEPLLPGKAGDPGRTASDNRLFVNGVLWVLRSGAPWCDLPERYGKWKSLHQRFARWSKAGVWERVFERSLLAEREWTTAWSFGAIGGLALYPMALGLGSFDPYEWGWPFSPLFVVIGALTVLLIWKQNRFGVLLVLAAVAFQLHLLESTNYWDYLLDPIYSLVSIVWLAGGFVTSMRSSRTKRYSKTLPPNISTI